MTKENEIKIAKLKLMIGKFKTKIAEIELKDLREKETKLKKEITSPHFIKPIIPPY